MAVEAPDTDTTVILGISIEPLDQIFPQLQSLPASSSTNVNQDPASTALARPPPDPTILAERIVRHLFNYLSGFAASSGGPSSGLNPSTAIPMSLIAKWYEVFVSKVKNSGMAFLEREGD
jgi:hypothetical protein